MSIVEEREDREMFEQRAQRAADAMNRKDLAAVMRPWADDGVFEMAGHTTLSGRYEGKAAIEALFRRIFERLEVIRFTVKRVGLANPVGLTYSNTLFIEMEVEETSTDGVTIHGNSLGVYEWRRGKLVAVREWLFDPTVYEAVWGRSVAAVPAGMAPGAVAPPSAIPSP
jgi:ketosteroid isomerase-like protein